MFSYTTSLTLAANLCSTQMQVFCLAANHQKDALCHTLRDCSGFASVNSWTGRWGCDLRLGIPNLEVGLSLDSSIRAALGVSVCRGVSCSPSACDSSPSLLLSTALSSMCLLLEEKPEEVWTEMSDGSCRWRQSASEVKLVCLLVPAGLSAKVLKVHFKPYHIQGLLAADTSTTETPKILFLCVELAALRQNCIAHQCQGVCHDAAATTAT